MGWLNGVPPSEMISNPPPSSVRPLTALPVYSPSSESKSLPTVVKVYDPFAGAVQAYQTDSPIATPKRFGSPASRRAPTLLPLVEPLAPLIAKALAKLSLAGAWASPTLAATLSHARSPRHRPARRPRKEIFIRSLLITFYSS